MSLDRVPPSDLAAERAVIGALMLHRDAIHDATEVVQAADFYQPAHELIFEAAVRLDAAGKPVDSTTVATALGADLPRVGGAAYLHTCIDGCVSWRSAGHYAEAVRDTATRRRLIQAGLSVVEAGYGSGDVPDLVNAAQAGVMAVNAHQSTTATLADAVTRLMDNVGSEAARPVPTAWPELDRVIGGLRPGCVYIIAGRPGTGKSVVGACMAMQVALRGSQVLLSSVEMSEAEVTSRLLSGVCEVDHERVSAGTLTEAEHTRIARAYSVIAGLPLHIDDRSDVSVSDVRATARGLAAKGRLGLVVVDYIQLLRVRDKRSVREQQVSEMSRALKVMAKELAVPVVVLAQLNREVEKRIDKHPLLSDLRESGSLEQDSDVVMLLHRDVDESPGEIQLGIGKNRHGRQGRVDLWFNGPYQRIDSPALSRQRVAS